MAAGATPQQIAAGRRRDASRFIKKLAEAGITGRPEGGPNGLLYVNGRHTGKDGKTYVFSYHLRVSNASSGETLSTPFGIVQREGETGSKTTVFKTPVGDEVKTWEDIGAVWQTRERMIAAMTEEA